MSDNSMAIEQNKTFGHRLKKILNSIKRYFSRPENIIAVVFALFLTAAVIYPLIKMDLIDEVARLLPGFPLVLHGSSSIPDEYLHIFNDNGGELKGTKGVPEELLRRVARTAVCKINIGTDFRVAFVGGLRKSLNEIKDKFEPRNFLVPARELSKQLVKEKLSNVFQSANKVAKM